MAIEQMWANGEADTHALPAHVSLEHRIPIQSHRSTSSVCRRDFLGVPLDLLDMRQTVEACAELIHARIPAQHVVINAGKVVQLAHDARLREIVRACALVNADGQSVVWAGRLLGLRVPERVAGIDLMERLLERAEGESWPVYFLGAEASTVASFVRIVRQKYPSLPIAGFADGYFDDDQAAAERIASSGARLLFVAMSSPRKEQFLAENLERLGALLAVGVGGSFEVWAGNVRRAPAWMQRAGLEWFYRLIQEPRRMWRRYVLGNARFVQLVAQAWFSARIGRA